MGKARRFLAVLVLIFLLQRAAIGQQPLHWDATIDSAKATARQSNRLVLVVLLRPGVPLPPSGKRDSQSTGGCRGIGSQLRSGENQLRLLPNTAKQYGVTRLPTTVILAPNARGEVLAVIPEYMPVDQYLSKLNKVAADAKQHATPALLPRSRLAPQLVLLPCRFRRQLLDLRRLPTQPYLLRLPLPPAASGAGR